MSVYCTYLVKEGTNLHSYYLLVQIKRPLRHHDYKKLLITAVFLVMIEFISSTSITISLLIIITFY